MDDAERAAAGVMAAAQFERALAREQAQRTDGFAVDLVSIGLSALAAVLRRATERPVAGDARFGPVALSWACRAPD